MHREEPESVYQHAAAVSDLSCFLLYLCAFGRRPAIAQMNKKEQMCSQLCRRDVTTKKLSVYVCVWQVPSFKRKKSNCGASSTASIGHMPRACCSLRLVRRNAGAKQKSSDYSGAKRISICMVIVNAYHGWPLGMICCGLLKGQRKSEEQARMFQKTNAIRQISGSHSIL